MADTPVASQSRPPQPLLLGDMLNIARGAQAYQQAEQLNPLTLQQQQQAARTGQIQLSVAEQADKERRNMQTVMANPSLYTTNGVYDPAKAAKITSEVAPLTGLNYLKDMAGSFGAQETFKTSAIGTQSAEQDFANKQVLGIASRLTSLINNPLIIASEQNPQAIAPEKLANQLKSYGEEQARALGIPKERAAELIAPYIEQASTNPAGVRQFLKDKLLTTLDQASRVTAMQSKGAPISTGSVGYQVETNQFAAQPFGTVLPGTQFSAQLGPGQRMEATNEVDINNNPIFNVKDENGRVVGQTTVQGNVPSNLMPAPAIMPAAGAQPGAAQPAGVTQMRQQLQSPAAITPAASSNAILRIPAGESPETGRTYQAQAIESRAAVQPSKVGLQNIDTVLKYLPLAATGKYSEATAGLQSVLGNLAGSKPEEIAAAARNTITKTINDLALQKNLALGGKFASSLEAAQSSLASAEMNPTAIAKSMEQLRPLLQNISNYSVGLDKAIEKSPIKQYVKPEFDAAFNQAFDMKALSFKSAFEQGKDLKKYVKENNINLAEQEQLLNKIQAYDYLANGDLAAYKAFTANLNRRR